MYKLFINNTVECETSVHMGSSSINDNMLNDFSIVVCKRMNILLLGVCIYVVSSFGMDINDKNEGVTTPKNVGIRQYRIPLLISSLVSFFCVDH